MNDTERHPITRERGAAKFRRRTWILFMVGMLVTGSFCLYAYERRRQGKPLICRPQIWSIGLYSGPSISKLSPCAEAVSPVMTAEKVTDVSADFVADPFMLEHDGMWFMFFEVLNKQGYNGDIGLATSQEGLEWHYAGIILDEPFHLSYPNVFAWRDEFYMIPESNRAGSIRLYKADSFPSKWSFQQSLIMGRYVDPTIFRYDDRWWLFATEIGSDTLHLFGADELEGPWAEHVKSPVIRNNANTARCAGRILVEEDRLLRFAQDCDPVYGNKVRVFEITKLSNETYEETEVSEDLLPCENGPGWNAGGMHHITLVKRDHGWRACVDGWRWQLRFRWKY